MSHPHGTATKSTRPFAALAWPFGIMVFLALYIASWPMVDIASNPARSFPGVSPPTWAKVFYSPLFKIQSSWISESNPLNRYWIWYHRWYWERYFPVTPTVPTSYAPQPTTTSPPPPP